jgi:two-component system, NarL family, nitrate/nitrite response regulator NarL
VSLQVLVVVETRLWRELLFECLAELGEFHVVAATGVDEAIAQVRGESVDLLLLDMSIPASTAAVAELIDASADARLVGLGFKATERRILTALESGMSGYVAQDGGLHELFRVISTVAAGGVACSPRIAADLVGRVRSLTAAPSGFDAGDAALTHREQEILNLIEEGLSNKEIAARLGIAIATVKNHVHRILAKLGVCRRSQAAAVARRRANGAPGRGSPMI